MTSLLTLAFGLNMLVLAIIVPQILIDNAGMAAAYGPDSPARRILTAVYIAILLASVAGIGLLVAGMPAHAAALGLSLFAVQIVYKVLTWPLAGISNPVVVSNLGISVVLVLGIIGAVAVLRS